MTNEEINDRIEALANGDSNDEEIDGLTEIIRELQESPTTKFNLGAVRGELMLQNDVVFYLNWGDVCDAAADNFDDEEQGEFACGIDPNTLSAEEMHTFRKCLEAGLGSWSEVVSIALMAATVGRDEIGGAASRAERFVETGDTEVLLEGLAPKVIRRNYLGGTEDITFDEFVRSAIQDDQVAREVAEKMLADPFTPYEWNPHEPEFHETFVVINEGALRLALDGEGS